MNNPKVIWDLKLIFKILTVKLRENPKLVNELLPKNYFRSIIEMWVKMAVTHIFIPTLNRIKVENFIYIMESQLSRLNWYSFEFNKNNLQLNLSQRGKGGAGGSSSLRPTKLRIFPIIVSSDLPLFTKSRTLKL